MATSEVSRRAFMFGVGALAVGAACGGATRLCASPSPVLRPPGALAEADFMARCIKCERCISACPTDVLFPLGIEAGFANARTPSIGFEGDCCTFCDECRIVCPTGAIGVVDPLRPDLGRIGLAQVQEERCLAFLQSGACGVCVDACPYGALSFDGERRPVVDEALCNGCGECVHVCPANVLTSFAGGSTRGIEVLLEAGELREGGIA